MPKHQLLSGKTITYLEHSKKESLFLDRVIAMANDPRFTEDAMIDVVYGCDNPVLDQELYKDRGAVTREVLKRPIYQVMTDWLHRKALAHNGNGQPVAIKSTMTVSEAAAELGITPSAVRGAIQSKRIAATKRGAGYLLDPKDVAEFNPRPRGREAAPLLKCRVGHTSTKQCLFKAKDSGVSKFRDNRIDIVVDKFKRAALYSENKTIMRMHVLVPAERQNEIKFGTFFVRGRFRVTEVTEGKEATVRFLEFQPS